MTVTARLLSRGPSARLSLLALVGVTALYACEGSEVRKPFTSDGATTTDTADGQDGSDGDVTSTGTLDFELVTVSGPRGLGETSVELLPADELGDYTDVPGFQVDIDVKTTGIADGTDVELFIDDVLIAPGSVTADEDLVGTASFKGVTIPTASEGVVVRIASEDPGGIEVSGTKHVTLDIGACSITVNYVETNAQCVSTRVQDGKVGVDVRVTLDEGICEQVRIAWELDAPGAIGGILPDADFDENGIADLFVELGQEGETIEGKLTVHATALHPSDENGNGTADAETVLDSTDPEVAIVVPDVESSTVLSEADDVEPGSPGIQVEITVSVDEVADLQLVVGGVPAETLTAADPGESTFQAVTITNNTHVEVRATDVCGNESVVETTFQVATEGSIVIVSPAEDDILLAKDDAVAGTTDNYDTSVDVVAPSADVGAVISVLCKPTNVDESVDFTEVGALTVATVDPEGAYSVDVVFAAPLLGELRCIARIDTPAAESDEVVFTVAFPAPTLNLTSPSANECFTTKSIPATGTTTGLDGQTITYEVTPGGSGSVAVVEDDGSFDGTIDLPGAAPDGTFTVTIDALDAFGNLVSDTQGATEITFALDTADPVLAVTAPATTTVGPGGDTNAATAGYQTTVSATLTDTHALGGRVCLVVNGGTETCQDVTAATTSFTNVTLAAGPNTLTLNATDACGNDAAEATRIVTLQVDNQVVIIAPADGTTLLAAADGDPATARVYELDFRVQGDAIPVGATINVECSGIDPTFDVVGSLTVATVPADHTFTVPVELDVDALGNDVACHATTDLPSPATSDLVDLRIGLPAPTLAIGAPAANACITSKTFTVSGTATSLNGRTVTLSGATGTATVATNAWSGSATVAADGPVTLGASASDTFGNNATATTVAVVVDSTAGTLALIAPTTTIDPDVTADEDPGTPGFQATVTIALSDANATGGDACFALNGGASQCQTVGASGRVSFTGVTFQPGDNDLVLSGEDRCGTSATTLPTTVTLLDSGDLTVAITTPAVDLVTAATSLDFVVSVSDENGPVIGATVTLAADGGPTGVTATDNGDGTYRFTAVALPSGITTAFVATATLDPRSGQSDARSVTQKSGAPTVTIGAPADGAVLNLVSAACQAGQTPCITTVTATTTNTEDGSTATLTVTCGAAISTSTAAVTSNAVSFANVSLAHGASCSVKVDVTDAVGQSATDTNTVVVDRVAPTVSIVSPGDIMDASADQSAGTAGIQAPLTVDLGGVEAGQVASAVFTWTEGTTPRTKTVTHTVATDTADGGTYVAAFEETPGSGLVTWPQGFVVTVTVTIADEAGNPGSDAQTTAVDVRASVRITAPTETAAACTTSCAVGTCHDGSCFRSWGATDQRLLVAVVTNITTTTNNVRVCSDHPSLAVPGAIVCASTPTATGPFRQVLLTSTAGGNTTLDLSTSLPDGFQHLVVEAQALPGGSFASSQGAVADTERERRVFVDVGAPVVSSLGSPSDTLAPIGTLNAAEQKGGVTGQYDIRFTASEAAHADIHVNSGIVASLDVPAGQTTQTVTLPEGAVQVWVVLRDAANNTSPATPAQGALAYNVTVDYTAPTLSFLQPNKPILNASDALVISVASDEEGGRAFIIKTGVGNVGAPFVTGGVATMPQANTNQVLIEGTSELRAVITDAAGNTANAGPITVLVDRTPPAVTLNAPVDGAALDDGDDADAGTAGFQVAADFTASAGAQNWTVFVANGCDSSGNNCQPRSFVASGAVPGDGHVNQLVSVDITGSTSFSKIIVEVTDVASNLASAEADVAVSISSCQLAFTNLPAGGFYNIANACAGGAPCASAQVSIGVSVVGTCPPLSHIDLFNNGSVVGTSLGGGNPSFTLTVNDGDHLSLESRAYNLALAEIGSTGVRVRDADFTRPAVSFVTRTINGFVTAAEGASVTYLSAQDVSAGTAGFQFHASVDVADAHASGGQVVSATATSGATTALVPSNVTLPVDLTGTTPIRQDLLDMTLADGATYTIVVTGSDAAGNTDTATFTAAVDISGPPEVPITAITITRRRPQVKIDFTNVAADGGPVSAYEVRYSPSPIDATNFASACLATAPELLGSGAAPAPGTPGTANTGTFGGPDTRAFVDPCKLDIPTEQTGLADQVWQYWAVRARDAAGNWSPLGTSSVKSVANKDVWLDLDSISFDTTAAAWNGLTASLLTLRGALTGDVDAGGRRDVIFGSSSVQAFCIVRGEAFGAGEIVLTQPTGANHACILPSQVGSIFTGANNIGHHVDGIGDVNGDGVADFAASGRITGTEGFVAIYLGRSGSLPDLTNPNIKIRGMVSGGSYNSWCGAGDFDGVGQVSGGSTVFPTEIAVGQSSGTTNALWILKGQASWTTATHVTFDVRVPADLTASEALVFNFDNTGGTTNPAFGNRCAPVGNLLPNASGSGTKGDLAVTQTGPANGRIFVIPGREWTGTSAVTIREVLPASPTGEDALDVRLRQDQNRTANNGFGTTLFAADVTNDGTPDIVVSHPLPTTPLGGFTPAIYIFNGTTIAPAAGKDLSITRVGATTQGDTSVATGGFIIATSPFPNFGSVRPIGDFNNYTAGGTPSVDLVIGLASATTPQTLPAEVDVRTNHVGGPTSLVAGTFPALDAFYENIYAGGTSAGAWVDGGVDLTGDGLPDIIAGSTTGRVIIAR